MLGIAEVEGEREVLKAWGATIRRYREWKRLSRRELAARAGLSSVFLGEIERGEKDPSTHSLSLLAAALDAPLGELFLRVAIHLDMSPLRNTEQQKALPLGIRESGDAYLDSVPLAQEETAFDLYKVVRLLRGEQQISLLMLARALASAQE